MGRHFDTNCTKVPYNCKTFGRIKQDKLIKDTLKFNDNEFITFSTVTKKGRSEVLSILEEKI